MADVSDPKIDEGIPCFFYSASLRALTMPTTAYMDVRSDKSDTNWLLLDYEVNSRFIM